MKHTDLSLPHQARSDLACAAHEPELAADAFRIGDALNTAILRNDVDAIAALMLEGAPIIAAMRAKQARQNGAS